MSFFSVDKKKLTQEDATQLYEKIVATLRTIYDPEIPLNIYDLGLIYKISIDEDAQVFVDMTLTAPACPVAGILPGQVEKSIKDVIGVANAKVTLVWEPPWDQALISDEAKLSLGLF